MRSLALTLASIFVISSLSFALPLYASNISYSNDPGFTMSPVSAADSAVTASGYFIYKLKNGGTVTGSVLLKNPGSKVLTIKLAAVDAVTAQTGGSAFETANVKPGATATWLKFAEASVTLAAGTQKQVDFTVAVPQSARPGQHLAGISAYVPASLPAEAQNASGQLGASVTMQTRYVIGVQVDIEGAWTPSLKIESVGLVEQPSGPYIGVQMKNDGDVFLKPSGTVALTDSNGRRTLEQPITMGTFVPGTEVTYPVKWSGELKPGDYQVRVELKYGEKLIARYDGPLKIGATSKVEAQPWPQTVQQPGRLGAGTIAPSVLERLPAKTPMIQRLFVVAFGGVILVALGAGVLAVVRGGRKAVSA